MVHFIGKYLCLYSCVFMLSVSLLLTIFKRLSYFQVLIEVYDENYPNKKVYTHLYVTVLRNIFQPVIQSRSISIFDYHDPKEMIHQMAGIDQDGVSILNAGCRAICNMDRRRSLHMKIHGSIFCTEWLSLNISQHVYSKS